MTTAPSPTHSVLVVDDDPIAARALVHYFRRHHLDAQSAADLASARTLLQRLTFDAVLLDLNLGRENGLDLARELATAGSPPFLITSARGAEVDRVVGLELGAHDYVVKPFSMRELLARVHGVIRRHLEPRRTLPRRRIARCGGWTVDLSALQARHDAGRTTSFTSGELGVLRALLAHPHRVLLRHELLAMTRRDDGTVFARTVDVLVTRLRKKIEDDPRRPRLIRTVRGEGYQLDADVTWQVTES